MSSPMRELGRAALISGLSERLKGTSWGEPEMAGVVNTYLINLGRTASMAIFVRLSPLVDMGLDVADGATAAAQLVAVQALPQDEFFSVVSEAWEQANGEPPPETQGYRNFLGESILDALRRLKRSG